jgi:glutathione synthase
MKIGIIMDPITGINIKKDSSFAMLLAAQARNWEIYYMVINDLFLLGDSLFANMRRLSVTDDINHWFEFNGETISMLADLDVILMRKDPPFDSEYLYVTYLLDHLQQKGKLIVNNPESLRNANEKLFITHFPQCIPPTLVTSDAARIKAFIDEHADVILKPLDNMGGTSIFRIRNDDPNLSVIIETLTDNGQRFTMGQKFIPEISAGDKRILLIDGKPIPYGLARIPQEGETRGNLAKGGIGKGIELDDRDKWICDQVGPKLHEMGLIFVGIDVIGQYLTEINVTSPTCIRELDKIYGLDIAGQLMAAIEKRINSV